LFWKEFGPRDCRRNLRETDAAWLGSVHRFVQRERETNLKRKMPAKRLDRHGSEQLRRRDARVYRRTLAEFPRTGICLQRICFDEKAWTRCSRLKPSVRLVKARTRAAGRRVSRQKRRRRPGYFTARQTMLARSTRRFHAARGVWQHDALDDQTLSDFCAQSQVVVCTDAEVRWRRRTSGGAGIVVVAGTGSIALGRDGAGRQDAAVAGAI